MRRTVAAQVMRGPLVLAKGRLAGTSRAETLDFTTINKQPRLRPRSDFLLQDKG